MSDPMTPERLRDQIAEKLAEWAFQAAEAKSVKLTNFHRHVIEQEAPVRADMVMTVVRPELERLRAELAETTHALEVTGEKLTAIRGQRDRAETERDQARADLAAFCDAGRTEDLAGLVRDYLGPAVDWQTTNGGAPEWLVQAVLDLLAPVAATRDAAHSELAEIHEQLREARTGQGRLAEQVKRVRAAHPPEDSLGRWTCGSCLDAREEPQPYPCPTIRALDEEPGR